VHVGLVSASARFVPQEDEAESIILNVSGRLLMFHRDRSGPQVKATDNIERPVSRSLREHSR